MGRPTLRQLVMLTLVLVLAATTATARNPIRSAFFNVYPDAESSRLADLPSISGHCGVCHFAFGGAGPRNAYGLAVEVAIDQIGDDEAAILSIENLDSDNDGYSNLVEITDLQNFTNTPTFPGLRADNLGQVSGVDPTDIEDHLTPGGATDTDPPTVTVTAPVGGTLAGPTTLVTVSWTAEDPSGIAAIAVSATYDSGVTWKGIARELPDTGTYEWFVPNRPGPTVIRVTARDAAGNDGYGDSDGFTIDTFAGGTVPTTLRDFDMPGTQPLEAGTLEDPSVTCVTCHGDFDPASEPYHNWHGSMMGQAMRDPVFLATMVIAEQDAPAAGDLCLRCHTPGGWSEGRSADTTGGQLNDTDIQAVQCDFCHRSVDPHYEAGVSPERDADILDDLATLPLTTANGQFIIDPDPIRRGPREDIVPAHEFLASPFHREGAFCGTCHDVSNPVFEQGGDPATYVAGALDAQHPDSDRRNMFPVERTFSEWELSEYATVGVYAPQFAGNRPDGMVSTCQDCHMRDISGASAGGAPIHEDLALHDLTGGNYFVPDILPDWSPDDVIPAALQDAKARAIAMLQMAATLEATLTMNGSEPQLAVTVTNETGHKLPSGYPEGRRVWLNVKGYDTGDALVYESGAYDFPTGVLTHDDDVVVYETEPGISHRLADALGIVAGPSFHFALADTIWHDSRIPPRGFNNAAFTAAQCAPVGHDYADGQYHDLAMYDLPQAVERAEVTLYYQSISKEYIEFLRDENVTNDLGQRLYDSWVAYDRAAPVVMATVDVTLDPTSVETAPAVTALLPAAPNPFNPATVLRFRLAHAGPVKLAVYDQAGRLVRTLAVGPWAAGEHSVRWDGRDQRGRTVAAGAYLAVLDADGGRQVTKLALVK